MPHTQDFDWASLLSHKDTAQLLKLALEQDVGSGDITTEGIFSEAQHAHAAVVARAPVVVCGGPLAVCLIERVDPNISVHHIMPEGSTLKKGDVFFELRGDVRSILRVERCMLNFLMRLCAISTYTRQIKDSLPPSSSTQILDTRKTLPGWRYLDKMAVQVGGGKNHRMGLFDAVLIKDNHISAAGGVAQAVLRMKNYLSKTKRTHLLIEVEVDNLEQLQEALDTKADIVLLDNFNNLEVEKAVLLNKNRVELEVSGGILGARVPILAQLGVHRISIGALTHSVKAADLALDML